MIPDDLFTDTINPLHRVMTVALLLQHSAHQFFPEANRQFADLDMPHLSRAKIVKCKRNGNGEFVYPSIEQAGVAGLYAELHKRNYKIVFANDLGLDIHGIDAIAFNEEEDRYLICEAKGTTLRINATYSYYLRNTKNKGRQLSHRWCWCSLVDYAFQSSTSGIFLRMLEPILQARYDRFLSVSHVNKYRSGYSVDYSTSWNETAMQKNSPWFCERYDLAKQKKWFDDICGNDSIAVQYVKRRFTKPAQFGGTPHVVSSGRNKRGTESEGVGAS